VKGVSALSALALAGWMAVPSLSQLQDRAEVWWSERAHLPTAVERWLYNPRERAERAAESLAAGDPDGAVSATDTALRLAPDDPEVLYNAGTARLAAGHEERSAELLQQAAEAAGPRLAPDAWFNTGNARLAAGDPGSAVTAFEQALRADPGHAEAKFNLEVALRESERQRDRRGAGSGSKGRRNDPEEPSDRAGGGGSQQSDPRSDSRRPQPGDESDQPGGGRPPSPGESDEPRPGEGDSSPLPGFRDQPEMSAQEAAALLESVENLERQQRREQAGKRARQRAASGKDW
jgi:Ca-activated chloride channel homolog